jgi:tyrosyl-tRNA synthetase
VTPISLADHGEKSIAAAFVTIAGSVPSTKQVRRIAADGGLRLVIEHEQDAASTQQTTVLTTVDADTPLTTLLAERTAASPTPNARIFLRCGRRLIELIQPEVPSAFRP